jgi:hypothetical protein
VSSPDGPARVALFSDAGGSGVVGGYLALRPVDAIGLELLATRSGVGVSSAPKGWTVSRPPIVDTRLSHLVAALAVEGRDSMLAAECFIGGGERTRPGVAFALGFEVARSLRPGIDFDASVEIATRSPAYVAPDGTVPLREAVYRAEASFGTPILSFVYSHRIDLDRRDPVPGLFRPKNERIDFTGTVDAGFAEASVSMLLERTIGSWHAEAVGGELSPEIGFTAGAVDGALRCDVGVGAVGVELTAAAVSASFRSPHRHRRVSLDVDAAYRRPGGTEVTVVAGLILGRSSVSVRARFGVSTAGVSIEAFSTTVRGKNDDSDAFGDPGDPLAETR